jgi:hypothetical protein
MPAQCLAAGEVKRRSARGKSPHRRTGGGDPFVGAADFYRVRGDASMTWKFWSKEADTGVTKLPRPRELPQRVGQYMVTKLKEDPDIIWNYKAVVMPREGSKTAFFVRVFNPAAADARGVRVTSYTSLEAAAELILFQGWYDQDSGKVELSRPSAAPRAA